MKKKSKWKSPDLIKVVVLRVYQFVFENYEDVWERLNKTRGFFVVLGFPYVLKGVHRFIMHFRYLPQQHRYF